MKCRGWGRIKVLYRRTTPRETICSTRANIARQYSNITERWVSMTMMGADCRRESSRSISSMESISCVCSTRTVSYRSFLTFTDECRGCPSRHHTSRTTSPPRTSNPVPSGRNPNTSPRTSQSPLHPPSSRKDTRSPCGTRPCHSHCPSRRLSRRRRLLQP